MNTNDTRREIFQQLYDAEGRNLDALAKILSERAGLWADPAMRPAMEAVAEEHSKGIQRYRELRGILRSLTPETRKADAALEMRAAAIRAREHGRTAR